MSYSALELAVRLEEHLGLRERNYSPRPATMVAALEAATERAPTRLAIMDRDVRLTYAEFSEAVRHVASRLSAAGLGRGDRFAIALLNCWEFAVAYFGVLSLGAIAVPISTRLTWPEVEAILTDCQATRLLTSRALRSIPKGIVTSYTIEGDLRQWVRSDVSRATLQGDPTEDDAAVILYTSGTTGRPKGAVQTHRNCVATAINMAVMTQNAADSRTLVVAPMFHATGLNAQLNSQIYLGATSVLLPRFRADEVLPTIERSRVTALAGVPSMLWLLFDHPGWSRTDLSSLSLVTVGGAPLPDALIQRFRAMLPQARLANVWGSTEATSVASWNEGEDLDRRPDSVGRATPIVDVAVVDGTGEPLPPGDQGQLAVRGPNVIRRYWGRPTGTEEAFLPDGWFRTGDIGLIDADGFIRLTGRAKDLVIRGGEKIYAAEVERVISQHPAVLDAAVVGIPHPVLQEVVRAVVVLKAGHELSATGLHDFLKERLADYKLPHESVFVAALPRNAAGKVVKDELRGVPFVMAQSSE